MMKDKIRELAEDDLPYYLALKAESAMMGKRITKKTMSQHFYIKDDGKNEMQEVFGVKVVTMEGVMATAPLVEKKVGVEVVETNLVSTNQRFSLSECVLLRDPLLIIEGLKQMDHDGLASGIEGVILTTVGGCSLGKPLEGRAYNIKKNFETFG